MRNILVGLALVATTGWGIAPAAADVKIGIDLALTGPTAPIIVPHKRTWDFLPKTLGAQPAQYIFSDDHGDPTEAVRNVNRFVLEDNVDAIFAIGTTPTCTAVAQVALDAKRPLICLSPVKVSADAAKWVFSTVPSAPVVVAPLVAHMAKNGAKAVGFIGFSDALGDVELAALTDAATKAGMKIVDAERYDRTATSVTAQVIKLLAAKPDVVYVGAAGTPGALPDIALREQGFTGQIYHNNAVLAPQFVHVGGQAVEGIIAAGTPSFVVDQLPDSRETKKVGLEFVKLWDDHYGKASRTPFGAYSYDAYLIIDAAVAKALKSTQPGTPEFHDALRQALEQTTNLVGANGVYTMSPTDHVGADSRAIELVQLVDGNWKFIGN